jgi:hypothetical protein
VCRSRPRFYFTIRTQEHVHFLERAEKTYERVVQMRRTPPRLPEIARPKLIRERDYGRAQRTIFVCALRPRQAGFGIDPQREAHDVICRRELPVPTLAPRAPG